MEGTAIPILEIGVVLLAAVAAGWLARRIGLPATVGYLAVGLGFSPFTPGYVADRHQLELLADVGVVLLLFEVGIEVDLGRLRRDHGPLLWAAPIQAIVSTLAAGGVFLLLGLEPLAAALVGLCVALSSSVVIVNITAQPAAETDKATEVAFLGWSVLQDLAGSRSRPSCSPPLIRATGPCPRRWRDCRVRGADRLVARVCPRSFVGSTAITIFS